MQDFHGKTTLKKLVEDVLTYGDLLLISNKGHGKTNALMSLAREFRSIPHTRVIVFEDFPKWCNEFDSLPFFVVHDRDVIETRDTIDVSDTFLSHDKDFTVQRKTEILDALKQNTSLIFVNEIRDIDRKAFFIYSVVKWFYDKAYIRAYKNYQKHEHVVFFIEESQNVFDSATINRKVFNRLRCIFNVARNLGLHFVLCSQRMQDLNPKIRGRTQLMIGNVSLDDYELKIRRLLKRSTYREKVLDFTVGKFLFTATDTVVQFQKFEQHGKPSEIAKPEQKPRKRKGVLGRFLDKIRAERDKLRFGRPVTTEELEAEEDRLEREEEQDTTEDEEFDRDPELDYEIEESEDQ